MNALVPEDPYRPVPLPPSEPRQTWWGRFAFVRRMLGGRWELRSYTSVLAGVHWWWRWVRVVEHEEWSGRDEGAWMQVLARQDELGRITWASPTTLWRERERRADDVAQRWPTRCRGSSP